MHRIIIDHKEKSAEAKSFERKIAQLGYRADIHVSAVYTVDRSFSSEQLQAIAAAMHNPVVERARIDSPSGMRFAWALELGFLPGVTDNTGTTAAEIIANLLDAAAPAVFSSKLLYITGELHREDIERIAVHLTNPLIERHSCKSSEEYAAQGGMDLFVPRVMLEADDRVLTVDLAVSDKELAAIGKKGVFDPAAKAYRGSLALSLEYMQVIQEYFRKQGRPPTDIEIESLAQTWSEHCKHTIFAAQLDDIKEGIYARYIKRATMDIRSELGEKDFCVSVFKDNAGGIVFDEDFVVTHKVETHNSPSALDPFGGAITGIVGVNRDTIGFGLGALPIANVYGFCVGRPEDTTALYRDERRTQRALSPKRILEGVVHGVNVGGNCSGIPTPHGFLCVDDSYRGKPLVFAGTVGLIPKILPSGASSAQKKARAGDRIVVIGGRVGKDGIHGATFSSEVLDAHSPATAVQIGDPITQKKFSDAIVKEARDRGLYTSITDNGAGGISCSVAEMAREAGGFVVELERVPLKYPGLQPWEIWISESQERMTLAVPPERLDELRSLMASRDVECTVIGVFTSSGRAVVRYKQKDILDLDMEFLHDGLPQRQLSTKPYPYRQTEHRLPAADDTALFEAMLGSHNTASTEFVAKQYDHEVQGTSVIKPLQGRGRVNGSAAVIRPRLDSYKGVVLSSSLYPRLSEISGYAMAACAIDTAIRNCVAAGGDIGHLALLDNFCWCSADEPERLHQLKDAARACYDYAVVFRTPYISGKDSMFNDFNGYDEERQVKISALPTVLISSIGVISDVRRTATMDLKVPGDLIYVVGETRDECGGSELYHLHRIVGGTPPKVDARQAKRLYEAMHRLHVEELLSACASVSHGGLLVALAKMALAGGLGVTADIAKVPHTPMEVQRLCYSETQSRFIITIDPRLRERVEERLQGFPFACMGVVSSDERFVVRAGERTVVDLALPRMDGIYRERYSEF